MATAKDPPLLGNGFSDSGIFPDDPKRSKSPPMSLQQDSDICGIRERQGYGTVASILENATLEEALIFVSRPDCKTIFVRSVSSS